MQQKMIVMTSDEVRSIIKEEVERALKQPQDRPVTRREASAILGKSTDTISRWEAKGELTRLHPHGHPVYSFL